MRLALPLCPWYLRDYGDRTSGTPRAPSVGRFAAALQSPGSSRCRPVLLPESLRVVPLRRPRPCRLSALPVGWLGVYRRGAVASNRGERWAMHGPVANAIAAMAGNVPSFLPAACERVYFELATNDPGQPIGSCFTISRHAIRKLLAKQGVFENELCAAGAHGPLIRTGRCGAGGLPIAPSRHPE